jgi:hypothetical protein
VAVTQMVIVNAESSVRTSMMGRVRTDKLAFWFIFSSEAIYFTITSPWIGDTLVSALEAWVVQNIRNQLTISFPCMRQC